MRRRDFLYTATAPLLGQGVATRDVKPLPRGKPSGLPFRSRLTDIAAQAGLTAPVIYGGVERKDYILETVGCGCAFVDYDNDGWLDIFVLSGTRMKDAPPGVSPLGPQLTGMPFQVQLTFSPGFGARSKSKSR